MYLLKHSVTASLSSKKKESLKKKKLLCKFLLKMSICQLLIFIFKEL